jgi:hypothetical protein
MPLMKKLFVLMIIMIIPYCAVAQKKHHAKKEPKLQILGHNDNWKNQAAPYSFVGRMVLETTHGIDTVTSHGDMDICLAWYDGNGDIYMSLVVGGKGKDTCYSISCSRMDSLFMIGSFSDTMIAGTDTLVSFGAGDAFVLCLTKKMICNRPVPYCSWAVSSGGTGDDCAVFAYRNPKGQLIVRGHYSAVQGETIHFGTTAIAVQKTGLSVFEPKYFSATGALVPDMKSFISSD